MCNSLNRKASEVAVAYLQWSKFLIKIRLIIIYKSRVVMKIIKKKIILWLIVRVLHGDMLTRALHYNDYNET